MKTTKNYVLAFWGYAFFLIVSGLSVNAQSVKDIDGKDYGTIKVGTKVWTVQNLEVTRFRNGDVIPEAKTEEEWLKAGKEGKPAWCYYDNDANNGAKYGKLYNWFAATDPRGLAPQGWHIPSNADWTALSKSQGGVEVAGSKMKSTMGWNSNGNGTNKSGFNGTPGGVRSEKGKFEGIGKRGQWWSTSNVMGETDLVYSCSLSNSSMEIFYVKTGKENGFSVRAVKD